MASDTSPIAEQGVATLSDEAWAQARHRAEIVGPLAALEVVGHEAADAAYCHIYVQKHPLRAVD